MSRDQKRDAIRVARIPEPAFDAAVESDDPPTVTELASRGKQAKPLVDLKGRDPRDYAAATQALGAIRRFAEFTAQTKPATIARGASEREHAAMTTLARDGRFN